MEFNVRKALMKDSEELNKMLTSLIIDEKKYDDNIDTAINITNHFEKILNHDQEFVLVAEDNNKKILGYVHGIVKVNEPVLKTEVKLDSIFIKEEYRCNGIGNKLIEEFKIEAKKRNCKYIQLNTLKNNEKANHLYLENGFKPKIIVYQCEL